MVLPQGEVIVTDELDVQSEADLPTLTYKLDWERGRVTGKIDRRDAMEQAIYKVLRTKRFAHLIYSDDYGFENMIGHERLFVQGELPRRIKEALLQDERITELRNFRLDFEKDEAFVSLTAITIYGDVDVLREAVPYV
ncbi:DUF2634 domain-containing protein [Sporosarcina trichiuri]|uniref:DUF2634 domain-containing protein n=1 Tax=Sporosarcina trichiuri TaxID=3056445 RepID=UPI0025B457D9|nr:DUF2634 domain-containing protein [Sporosarcina sp. 0.2-SM1T-5]WJY27484.1 DUF2634 domain-containing protein [Sporosarcina sp. 0.2-SM1T-5]